MDPASSAGGFMTCLAAAAGIVSVLYPAKRKLLWALVVLFLAAALVFFALGVGIRDPLDTAGFALAARCVVTLLAMVSMIWLMRQTPQPGQPKTAVRASVDRVPVARLPVSDPIRGMDRGAYEITVTDEVQPGVPEGHLQLLPQVYWTKTDPKPIRCLLSEAVARGLARDGWKVVKVSD